MPLNAAITTGERLQRNLKGSPLSAGRDLLDFAEHDLADVVAAMIEAQETIRELQRQLNADYPDEVRIMVYEHNQAMEERVPTC